MNTDYHYESDVTELPECEDAQKRLMQWIINSAQMDQPIYTDEIVCREYYEYPKCPPRYCLNDSCSECEDWW